MSNRRGFSSTARALFRFIWDGTTPDKNYENMFNQSGKNNPKFSGTETVKFAGKPHISLGDPKMRASGKVFKDETEQCRLTSVHVYEDGTIVYSKQSFNDAQQ